MRLTLASRKPIAIVHAYTYSAYIDFLEQSHFWFGKPFAEQLQPNFEQNIAAAFWMVTNKRDVGIFTSVPTGRYDLRHERRLTTNRFGHVD